MRRLVLLLAAALVMAACPLPIRLPSASTGTITISVASAGRSASRTVVTDFTKQIDEIEVDLHSNDGYADPAAAFCSAEPWQVTVTQVPVGSWDLHVAARKDGVQVASADQNGLILTAGAPLSVPITLSFTAAAATGSVQFTVSFPDTVGIDYVQGVLQETSDTFEPALSSAGGYTSGTFQFSNLPTGTYSLVMTFRRGGPAGSSAGIFREKVVVLGGFQSSGWVNGSGGLDSQRTLGATDFLEDNVSLGGLEITGVLTSSFDTWTTDYPLAPVLGLPATVDLVADVSIDGQYIQYSWNSSGWNEAIPGVPVTLATAESNELVVRVTAPDRQAWNEYTVSFRRGYSVTYHGNGSTGGTPPTDANVYIAGDNVTVLGNTGGLTWSGKTFLGWNTHADGSGLTGFPNGTFVMGTANVDLYAWFYGQPVKVVAVSAGGHYTMILREDGTLWATGANGNGQLGLGDTADRHTPQPVMSDVSAVSAGYSHTMILKRDGSLWGCGSNSSGQLGDGTTTQRTTPVRVRVGVIEVSAGQDLTVFLTADGRCWATGNNQHGQLGNGTTTNVSTPVMMLAGVAHISAGYFHSLFLLPDGSLYATGANGDMELGLGDTTDRLVPTYVTGGIASVHGGGYFTLLRTTTGNLVACGANGQGQLGVGDTTNRSVPTLVTTQVAFAEGGGYHVMFVKTDGSLWGAGYNAFCQVGDGSTTDRHSPVQVMTGVATVSGGDLFSMIVKTDGTLWGTGQNDGGQLGDGTTTGRGAPVQITMP